MYIKYFALLLVLGVAVTVPATALEKAISNPHRRTSNADAAGNKSSGRTFDSVIVQHADGKQDARAVPLSLSRGKPITREEDFLAGKWSPDGNYILLTKGKYRGLYLLSLADRSIRTLSEAPGVGYAAEWSRDGRFVIIRDEEYDRIQVLDLHGRQVAPEKASFEEENAVVYTEDDAVYFRSDETRPAIKVSRGDDKFFMPRLSPDRKKIAYIGLSSGIHITNLESGKTVAPGLGTDIEWMPDSKGIIYTYTEDDGHKITASNLYFAYADGSMTINLTNTPSILESHPALSPEGNALVYMVDGQVFLSEFTYSHP